MTFVVIFAHRDRVRSGGQFEGASVSDAERSVVTETSDVIETTANAMEDDDKGIESSEAAAASLLVELFKDDDFGEKMDRTMD